MKVAVVGSGVSGLGATWLLNEHSDHEVHLYESDYRPGGHANTVRFMPEGKTWPEGVDVDTGFIVFNPSTYPNFLRFLRLYPPTDKKRWSLLPSFLQGTQSDVTDEGIRIDETEMTFSVSRDSGAFEWAGKNLATVFCQLRNLVDPQMWRMVYDVMRFNACARRVFLNAKQDEETEMSIGEYLNREGYSAAFRNNYLIPMTAAIWSTPPDKCFLDFPARTLIQFLYNHHLLQITGKPSWLTIHGGSHKYVNKILAKLPEDQLHLSTPITSIKSIKTDDDLKPIVVLTTADDEQKAYDHVILACHSDTALQILKKGGITQEEERILSQFDWNKNEVILHSDTRLMPKSRMAWSCWNYLTYTKSVLPGVDGVEDDSETSSQDTVYSQEKMSSERATTQDVDRISLTYGMNDLQHIPESRYGPVLVTLNPPFEPEANKIGGRWKYDHPVLDTKAVKAQNEMYKIQNTRSISYAGAYLKYGFHEDGFTSGLLAACSIDEDQGGPSCSPASTSALKSTAIPVRRRSVRPPFEIQHADHHVSLSRRGSGNLGYEVVARLFDWLETSGTREFVGTFGAIVLTIAGWLLGIREL
ncbi:amine oxidase [Crassisporium funariophilum]|nr:amine oxidase [Crassisporium funariophilum]